MNPDQYPPIPKGYLRWEPRPEGWKPDKEVKYAFFNRLLSVPQWQEMPGLAIPIGSPYCDYIEAVREPDAPNATPPTLEQRIHAVRLAAGNNQFTIELCGDLAEICTLALSAAEWKCRAELTAQDIAETMQPRIGIDQ
jgi:hypothetical protein